ncbi:aminotransferase class V-fold PLP-dependent enzyme [Salisediminibacterium selenitireducens]|uniref:cysteine desulfurase n=1 Tax=Bacillus selenitireducens (strain ATCC 700615 / DSM 15326 / MLS10) TaxID=439292 RepID=D6Y1L0_BACIE|nr:aminotransferase class V-fold PLP-dependent enzyme [Salisediminibacterium selenitireducens]ADI00797.1 cysteine desulfurase family protein [[Bacillus] selenitireducens MLS10]
MIYFDHAASSFPKPESVVTAVTKALTDYGANPGRGGHGLSRQAGEVIDQARTALRDMFDAPSKERVVFSMNATQGLNQILQGFLFEKGDHLIMTVFEHNSVSRPVEKLKKEKGVDVSVIAPKEGENWRDLIEEAMNERTRLVMVTHGSNVTGEILPIREIGELLRDSDAAFAVDASQTAGILPISMKEDHIDFLAFPGHKGLLGPQGTGVMIAGDGMKLTPLILGGTGTESELKSQPEEWPHAMESGTMNTPGIAGLLKGIEAVDEQGYERISSHEEGLAKYLVSELKEVPGLEAVEPLNGYKRLGVVSIKTSPLNSHELAMILDDHYNIAVRAGLHCSPLVHEYLNTSEHGLLRVSFGLYNTMEEIDDFIRALQEIMEHMLE